MKKIFAIGLTIIITNVAIASNLPGSVIASSKNAAFEQLVEWMQEGPFYKITKVAVSESTLDSGEDVVDVIISFDDSLGCNGRSLEARCLPDNNELLCMLRLSDCIADGGQSSTKLFNLIK